MKLKTTQMNLDPVKLRGRYERLRNDVDYRDVTITSHDVTVQAHKCVLAVSSEFFKVLFQRAEMNKRHSNRSTFDLGGFTSDEAKYLEPVVDFLYSGTIYINDMNFVGLVKIAEYLTIDELLEVCEHYINQYAGKENYLKLYLDLKRSVLNNEGTKGSGQVSLRTNGLLKLIWELVEMNFYNNIIETHEFFETLPLEVENLMLDNCQVGKVLKLAQRWMKTWPLGYTFADSLINIVHDKLMDTIKCGEKVDRDCAIVKTTLSVKDQIQNRTVPKSNKANMINKLDKVIEHFGEGTSEKKSENSTKENPDGVDEDKNEASEKVKYLLGFQLDEKSDKTTEGGKDAAATADDGDGPITDGPILQALLVRNPGFVETDGVLDLSAKESAKYVYPSMPKLDDFQNAVESSPDSQIEMEVGIENAAKASKSDHLKEIGEGKLEKNATGTGNGKKDLVNSTSTQTKIQTGDGQENKTNNLAVMAFLATELGEIETGTPENPIRFGEEGSKEGGEGSKEEREGLKKDKEEVVVNIVAEFEDDMDSGVKLDGTADFDVEAEKADIPELTEDNDEDGEVAMETGEDTKDEAVYPGKKENGNKDDDVISIKSEDEKEDKHLTKMVQDRVSECLNFQDKYDDDTEDTSAKSTPIRVKITKRKGGRRSVAAEDPDYEVPCKKGRRKKSIPQSTRSRKTRKSRMEIINDSNNEAGIDGAVVKVEVERKSIDSGENAENGKTIENNAESSAGNGTEATAAAAKDSDNEEVFNEFIGQPDDDNNDDANDDDYDDGLPKSKRSSPSKGRQLHQCEICQKVYSQKYRLRQHMNMHLGIKPHKCVVCCQMFSRTDHVIRHMRSQHCDMSEFNCDMCEEKFEKPNEIVAHYLAHTPNIDLEPEKTSKTVFTEEEEKYISTETNESGKVQYGCKVCEKTFKKPYQAREHVNFHTGEKPYKCEQCDTSYAKKDNLTTHVRMVHDGVKGEFQCPKCKRNFFKLEFCESHIEKCTPSFKCDKCPKEFYRKTHLDNHKPVHMSTPQIACPHCDSKFKYRKHLNRHMKKEHSEEKCDALPIECICDQCGIVLKSKEALYRHKKVHKVPDKECDVCGKAFKDNTTLKDHKLMHTNIRDYQCEICSMLFSRKGNLVRHQKRHRGERKYRCDICGMCFVANCDLTRHKNTHLGVKKFPCRFCGRKFGLRSKVTVHERTHTGERPYFCREESCGKTFKQTGDRVRHEKKVHNLVFNKYMTLYELATGETEDIYKRADGEEFKMSEIDVSGDPTINAMKMAGIEVPAVGATQVVRGGNVAVERNPAAAEINPNSMSIDSIYIPPLTPLTGSVPSSTVGIREDGLVTNSAVYAGLANSVASNSVLKNTDTVSQDAMNAAIQLATTAAIQTMANMAPTDLRLVSHVAAAGEGDLKREVSVEDTEMSHIYQRTVSQFNQQMM